MGWLHPECTSTPADAYAPPVNPYAPPTEERGFRGVLSSDPGALAYRAHSGALKWVYLATVLGGLCLAGLGVAIGEDVGGAVAGFGLLIAFLGRVVVTLLWVHGAWAAIPEGYRVTAAGRQVSPGEAVGYLFVPFYNLYWMFVASGGLCEALDNLLRNAGSTRTTPKGLSIAACVTQLVPYVNLLVAPFLWLIYMFGVDAAAKELEAASGAARRAS